MFLSTFPYRLTCAPQARQGRPPPLCMTCRQISRNQSQPFYDSLQQLLWKQEFGAFAESLGEAFYADNKERPSIPPGRYFRMLPAVKGRGKGLWEGSPAEVAAVRLNAGLLLLWRPI